MIEEYPIAGCHAEKNQQRFLERREWLFLVACGGIFVLSLLVLFLPLNHPQSRLFGLPSLILCFSGCFVSYALLTAIEYLSIFRHWRSANLSGDQ